MKRTVLLLIALAIAAGCGTPVMVSREYRIERVPVSDVTVAVKPLLGKWGKARQGSAPGMMFVKAEPRDIRVVEEVIKETAQ